MTKTERILSYLPGTFCPAPQLSAMRAIADAFGTELQNAENSLAAIMQAHWVDHADRGTEIIDDLACLAALYGLAPRADESMEEFREHLKRYVRTHLDGTVTVQGILRVTAEALNLQIDDDFKNMDTWWNRKDDELVTVEPRSDDAAELVFGFKAKTATGSFAFPAQVTGTVDLSGDQDLQEKPKLYIKVDDQDSFEIDLLDGANNPIAVTLEEMVAAINNASDTIVADHNNRYLIVASSTIGSTSRLEILEGTDNAADQILGLAPWTYCGSEAFPAKVTGTVDLSGGVNLSDVRYLRLVIDGTHIKEIDCTGPDMANTTLEQISNAINDAFGLDPPFASHDGHFLALTSPTTGFNSSIAFQQPAAQDATARLFGLLPTTYYTGQGDLPARFTAKRNLSQGVDLSERSNIRLKIDGVSETVDCAGSEPVNTRPAEIVGAINTAFELNVASHNGGFITLNSPTVGLVGEIILEIPPSRDATEDIFGIRPRSYQGAAATSAQILGTDLSQRPTNLWGKHFLKIAVDGGPLVEIDIRAGAADPGVVTLDELVDAINTALGGNFTTHDGRHLILTSLTTGGASSLKVVPMETTFRRRFVTRAKILDEAAQIIFGFVAREGRGQPSKSARLEGTADLSRGVDLRENRYLRLIIDDRDAIDIDCTGKRPRATLIDEVVKAINAAFKLESNVASHDGRHLILTSPSSGTASKIAIQSPRAVDALDSLLGLEPGTYRGQEGTSINFVGTVDLSEGIDLEANAAVKLSIDTIEPLEIVIGDAEPTHKTINQIIIAINLALDKNVATNDGARIILTSWSTGVNSRIEFKIPDGTDATATIFGITPPRRYQGIDELPPRIIGKQDLSGGIDLQTAHILRLSIDGGDPKDVDCASQAADPGAATLDEIVEAINKDLGEGVASHNGGHLILKSLTSGMAGLITLEPYTSGDAGESLLGKVEYVAKGEDPIPAVIIGEVDLLKPIDLSKRSVLRVAVDGDRPVDIDISGENPETTFLDEIVEKINAVFPGLAEATEDDRLQLKSTASEKESHLSLLPLRYLELIDYPPESMPDPEMPEFPWKVKHGDSWSITNDGVAETYFEPKLNAPNGVFGPMLVNKTLGWRVRLLTMLLPGEGVRLWRNPEFGLQAEIILPDGDTRPVPGSEILSGPLDMQVQVPFEGECPMTRVDDETTTLQLNNPSTPGVVRLRALQDKTGGKIMVTVNEGDPAIFDFSSTKTTITNGGTVRLKGYVRADEEGHLQLILDEKPITRLRKGPIRDPKVHQDRIVVVTGPIYHGELTDEPPLLIVQEIFDLFDVTLRSLSEKGEPMEETYNGVTIGVGTEEPDSLEKQINIASELVTAEELDKGTVLKLASGRSDWIYQDCHASRFDHAWFDADATRFVGNVCTDRGVFNVSRFSQQGELVIAVFASSTPFPDPAAEIVFRWVRHQPGSFIVNLPTDLPARFGGRFNEARFGQREASPELYEKAVTEPSDDEHFLVTLINEGRPDDDPPVSPSNLVTVEKVKSVPLGWDAVPMPFRKLQFLTLGDEERPACLYLAEEGLDEFIKLEAREGGIWGNEIAVSARQSGPAMYDVSIIYEGACFENARQVALGMGPPSPLPSCQKGKKASSIQQIAQGEGLPTLIRDLLQPCPIGVLQAKAAGIRANVFRAHTQVFDQ
ncbi:MAG: hypothetical protein BA864_09460 [Desulfuromonadales bacterium C00003093]|nr:MAG: hypothetical protein BA864_09460 [Desulfuromonadales bacterium C00003093]